MKTIQVNIKNLLVDTKGKFFTIEWYKKDGTLRKAVAQTNVKKGINGTGRLWSDAENQLTAYEHSTGKRIVITTDRVTKFKCGNRIMTAEQ